ncbi:uncharacterized protein TNIN_190911 [Trichonephila inaurata madagascariensis]|uniref:Uncharacterized protein n=1 Tax=Trichonephila inaurata madagascariensis TaxID=2747483 RepID=A0A8X6YR91_9ARAC|nr:uncharacterized protein TNIN_190911 [Trichonephila inaurata madagascariensis]
MEIELDIKESFLFSSDRESNFFHSVKRTVSGEESDIPGEEAEEYDEKLSEFIKEILENFREQMPEGIPDIGIPPIDPLVIPDIDEDIDDGIAKMVLRMRDINILGISKFHIVDLKADLEKGFANFSISLPELTASGNCYMNGKILGIFPMNSDGPFNINVTEVSKHMIIYFYILRLILNEALDQSVPYQ